METLGDLLEALGLILGSFVVAIGLIIAAWASFARAHHPEWGALAITLGLIAVLVTRLVGGEFMLMVTILMGVATPFVWIEGQAWRRRQQTKIQGSGFVPHKFW